MNLLERKPEFLKKTTLMSPRRARGHSRSALGGPLRECYVVESSDALLTQSGSLFSRRRPIFEPHNEFLPGPNLVDGADLDVYDPGREARASNGITRDIGREGGSLLWPANPQSCFGRHPRKHIRQSFVETSLVRRKQKQDVVASSRSRWCKPSSGREGPERRRETLRRPAVAEPRAFPDPEFLGQGCPE